MELDGPGPWRLDLTGVIGIERAVLVEASGRIPFLV